LLGLLSNSKRKSHLIVETAVKLYSNGIDVNEKSILHNHLKMSLTGRETTTSNLC